MATTTPNFQNITSPTGGAFDTTKCYALVPGSTTQTMVVPCSSQGALKGADLNTAKKGLANSLPSLPNINITLPSIGNAIGDVFNQALSDLKYGAILVGVLAMALLMMFVGLHPGGGASA